MNTIELQHKRLAIKDSRWLSKLPAQLIDKLAQVARVQRKERRVEIIRRGETAYDVYLLVNGAVAITTITEVGHEVLLDVLGPGELIGEIAAIDGGKRTATVTTLGDCEFLVLPLRNFLDLMTSQPDAAQILMSMVASRLRTADEAIEDSATKPLPQRLARRILNLSKTFGEKTDDGIRIKLKLSQQQLGNMVGARREHVNRQLRLWQSLAWITHDDGQLVIRKPNELEAVTVSENEE